jgi:hypothetical protein
VAGGRAGREPCGFATLPMRSSGRARATFCSPSTEPTTSPSACGTCAVDAFAKPERPAYSK